MGIALPTAIAAKLVHPDRKVVTVNGDGGFLMNVQELETAVRLRTADRQRDLGELASSARSSGSRTRSSAATSAPTSRNPDFVKLADAFGMPAWRCEAVDDFGRHLRHALVARRARR